MRVSSSTTGRRGVPPNMAVAGKDTLAAYLLTQRGYSVDWATHFFEVERDTVYTNLSWIRNRAEQARAEHSDSDE